jgi:hypothetical protein
VESSAGTGSAQSRQAVSAATRSSLPHRGSPTVASDHASHCLARPFRARDRRATPASRPDCTLLGFPPLQRMRSRGFGSRRCPTPATVRPQRFSRSRRLAPRDPGPGLFHPGNAPGVSPSGPCTSRGAAPVSRPVLSCRSTRPRGRSATRTDRGSRALIPPESSYRGGPKTCRGRCPPGVLPSKALSLPGGSSDRCPAKRLWRSQARVGRILPCTSPAGLAPDTAVLRSVGPPEGSASPLAGRRPLWGSSPRPA